MGKALFTLFAVFAPLFEEGAEVPYFTGRGGSFFHMFSRIPRLWGLPGGPLYALFHVVCIILGPWARHFSRYLQCFCDVLGRARECRKLRDAEGLFCMRPLERITGAVLKCVRGARS